MWLPLTDLRLFGESARADELLSSEAAVQKKYRQKGAHKVRAEYKKLVSATVLCLRGPSKARELTCASTVWRPCSASRTTAPRR